MENIQQVFTRYFEQSFWGNDDGSSGPNSAYDETPTLRENLQAFFDELHIKTLYDAGCGDANLFHFLNINSLEQYTGAEIVDALTVQNQHTFSDRPNMKFVTANVVEDVIPCVDVILSRDVVHYLPNEMVRQFLENCRRSGSTYLLVTHNLYSDSSANSETEVGVFRPVNLTQAPFFWPEPMKVIEEDAYGKALALYALEI